MRSGTSAASAAPLPSFTTDTHRGPAEPRPLIPLIPPSHPAHPARAKPPPFTLSPCTCETPAIHHFTCRTAASSFTLPPPARAAPHVPPRPLHWSQLNLRRCYSPTSAVTRSTRSPPRGTPGMATRAASAPTLVVTPTAAHGLYPKAPTTSSSVHPQSLSKPAQTVIPAAHR